MRIKFLAIIAGFLFVSIAISSCLDSDDATVELSSDATVYAFGIDTVYGKYYKFTIDQLNRRIYNRDSLPVGADTVIDRILIDTFSVSGWITSKDELDIKGDTLFNMSDSVDLSRAMNKANGMKFKVHAPDGVTVNEYTLEIRVHLQDPDSLVWNKMASPLPTAAPASGQKAVLFDGKLWVFTQDKAYWAQTRGEFSWTEADYTGFPAQAQLASIVRLQYKNGESEGERLYIVTENNDVYSSDNGTEWAAVDWEGISGVKTLIASFPDVLTVITTDNKVYTVDHQGSKTEGQLTDEHKNFPVSNIYSTSFRDFYQPQVMIVGKPAADAQPEQTIPWVSENGKEWVSLANTSSYDVYCPPLASPAVMHYGDSFYIFGSAEPDKLDAIYSSIDGISWRKTKRKFLLDEKMTEITAPYSIVADTPYIWVIFGGDGKTNAVWRGHLNKLLHDAKAR